MLRDQPVFMAWLARADHPLVGALFGVIFTAVVQSSSVTTGLAILFVQQGLLPPAAAIPIVIGANLGTTSTGIVASLRMDRVARATAVTNFLFNAAGVLVLLPVLRPLSRAVVDRVGAADAAVAWAHLGFNLGLGLICLLTLRWWAPPLARRLGVDRDPAAAAAATAASDDRAPRREPAHHGAGARRGRRGPPYARRRGREETSARDAGARLTDGRLGGLPGRRRSARKDGARAAAIAARSHRGAKLGRRSASTSAAGARCSPCAVDARLRICRDVGGMGGGASPFRVLLPDPRSFPMFDPKSVCLLATSAAALAAGACAVDPPPLADEHQLAQGAPALEPRRSLAITELPILERFGLERVLDQLVATSGVAGLDARTLFQQGWDVFNPGPGLGLGPHCDDTVDPDLGPTLNGSPTPAARRRPRARRPPAIRSPIPPAPAPTSRSACSCASTSRRRTAATAASTASPTPSRPAAPRPPTAT
ncbi:MAG: Na/Pi symporter [Kofleriaceae bacterium]|nr:Na/Pi symporter [Kofleriaceae bacterium]